MSKQNLRRYVDDVASSLLWNYNEKLDVRVHYLRLVEAWKADRPVGETVLVILNELGRRYSS